MPQWLSPSPHTRDQQDVQLIPMRRSFHYAPAAVSLPSHLCPAGRAALSNEGVVGPVQRHHLETEGPRAGRKLGEWGGRVSGVKCGDKMVGTFKSFNPTCVTRVMPA